MSIFSQIWSVTIMNLQGLPQRWGASIVTVIGVATVVAVMVSMLAMGAGVRALGQKDGRLDRVMVTSAGSAEFMSSISPAQVAMISQAPGIRLDTDGKPMVQAQAGILVEGTRIDTGGPQNIMLRGTGPMTFRMNPSLRVIEGRMYRAGVHELIAGRSASQRFRNLKLGDDIMLRGVMWHVVGVYEDKGGLTENAMLADANTVLAAFDRTGYQSVSVMLTSAGAITAFRDALSSNPQLDVEVKTYTQYYADQVKSLNTLLNFVSYFVGGVMAVGAVFGALTTMYSAVDARAREIATLRAIGFGGTGVVISVVVESLILAIPGAMIGGGIAFLLFNSDRVAVFGLSFPLMVTPELLVQGIFMAIFIGLIGGLAPSIRAARLPVATALRAT